MSALNAAHDTHLLAIDNKEDKITHRASNDLAKVLEEIQSKELARNRKKVSEVDKYIEGQRIELSSSSGHISPVPYM